MTTRRDDGADQPDYSLVCACGVWHKTDCPLFTPTPETRRDDGADQPRCIYCGSAQAEWFRAPCTSPLRTHRATPEPAAPPPAPTEHSNLPPCGHHAHAQMDGERCGSFTARFVFGDVLMWEPCPEPAAPPPAPTDNEAAMRAFVSRQWAEDWNSPEDALYDGADQPTKDAAGCVLIDGKPYLPMANCPEHGVNSPPPPAPTEDVYETAARRLSNRNPLTDVPAERLIPGITNAGPAPTEDVAALVARLRERDRREARWSHGGEEDDLYVGAADALERLTADLAAANQREFEYFALNEHLMFDLAAAESRVAAVRALCDEADAHPGLLPDLIFTHEVRAALDGATPAATEDAGV